MAARVIKPVLFLFLFPVANLNQDRYCAFKVKLKVTNCVLHE